MTQKYVYFFGPQGTEGDATMKNSLGGKGANLAEMAKLDPARPVRLHYQHRVLHGLLCRRKAISAVASR